MTKRRGLLLIVLGVFTALVYAQFSRPSTPDLTSTPHGRALLETFELISQQYLQRLSGEELDKIIQGGIQGMVEALEDPFTSYSSPRIAQTREEDLRGEFFGIGVEITAARGDGTGARIVNVFRSGPAFRAGLRVGDEIVEVDGEDVTSLQLLDIVARIRGPRDTTVQLGIKRGDSNATLVFEIVREKIEIVSVSKAMLPDGVGYVAIETFGNLKVTDQLAEAIRALEEDGATKLVLDLRDNGGGLLDQGCSVADAFLDSGVIVYTRMRDTTRAWCEASRRTLWDGPMVVLVNGNSASASEIVAGALQDYDRAPVIGEKTFGKGVGQSVFTLANGGKLTLVTFEWLTPQRRGINQEGITPDFAVRDTRFPTPLAFEGTGAPPGATVTLTVDGRTFTAVADEEGAFSFSETLPPRPRSDVQGEATLDLEHDAILKKALEVLKDL